MSNLQMLRSNAASGRYFVGPDQHTYKWKLESTHCWVRLFSFAWVQAVMAINVGRACEQLKSAESDSELVRFHQKNLGILKQAHPAYLDVSPKVVPMLDHVILTFVYVESLRQKQRNNRRHRGRNSMTMMNNNATIMNSMQM